MRRISIILSATILVLITACNGSGGSSDSSEDVPQAVIDYLQAKTEGDEDALRQLLCAEMEGILAREANTFASVEAELVDASCETTSSEDNTARVQCEGHIFVDYGQEESELPLTAYRVVKEDGEWKWCGETD